jgi:hypothetical protein
LVNGKCTSITSPIGLYEPNQIQKCQNIYNQTKNCNSPKITGCIFGAGGGNKQGRCSENRNEVNLTITNNSIELDDYILDSLDITCN